MSFFLHEGNKNPLIPNLKQTGSPAVLNRESESLKLFSLNARLRQHIEAAPP